MKKLSIVFNNADYTISNYEVRKRPIRALGFEYVDYSVYFEDERMKEQFGNPFEFNTQSKPKFGIFLPDSKHRQLAEVILKAIHNMEIDNNQG